MARKSKQDWIDLAFTKLIENGLDALSAEPMARELGVTRGSFYHHFKSRTDFLDQVLQGWEDVSTGRVFQLSQEGSPEERLKCLSDLAWSTSLELDAAVRAWALHCEMARDYVCRVDEQRLAYVTSLYEAASSNKATARKLARVAYFGFLGVLFYQPKMTEQERNEFRADLHSLLPR